MPETIIMRGAHVLTDARRGAAGVIRDGAVVITDGTIAETGPFAALQPKHPGARILGDGTQLLLPGLVDAHSHGRGLSPIQKGVRNDFLENALFDWAYMPVLPPELCAALCAWRHLRSGCTLLHHNGFDDDGPEGARRAHAAIRTYLSTGIRLAFSPGVRDESKLAMGGEAFIDTLPPDLREAALPLVFFDKEAFADAYFRLFDELFETYDDGDTRILLAPCWAHGASEAFLRRVREKSDARGGVMIHMHLLQSPVQKAYGLRRHGKPTVFWLDDLGLVDSRVVYGHAIHVTEPEIALMGRRRVSVTSHPSCNFHMRNGITPVMPLRAAGVNVALGLDDKTINDDEDAVMEVRMMHKVHRLHSFELTVPALGAWEALEIATVNGARAAGFAGEVGALLPGMKGDAILVYLDRVARDPWIDPALDIADAFVERAMGADVATVVVGGKVVVEDRRLCTIDIDGLYREVRAFCAKGLTPEQRARADLLGRIKPYVQAWYDGWHRDMVEMPFYRVNSRE
ncbi:MAG TPA: amidohydrolase family protein [Stellaceae bacterium]|nr:amidohydrolase family protein [Stellaceae bacterium]